MNKEQERLLRLKSREQELLAQGKSITKCPPGIPRGYITPETEDLVEQKIRAVCLAPTDEGITVWYNAKQKAKDLYNFKRVK